MAAFFTTSEHSYFGPDGQSLGGADGDRTLTDFDGSDDAFSFGEQIAGGTIRGPFFGTWTAPTGDVFVILEEFDNTLGSIIYRLYGNPAGGPGSVIFPSNFSQLTVDNTGSGASFTVCFAAGTLIATPAGERAVETLAIGDLVTTADGRAVPVKWIGRQTVHKLFTPTERFVPVRVKAGALGDGLPHTDLVLTAEHALILDGLAINAGALVNGTSIAYEPIESLPERVTYYHVETEAHEVILANGAAAESYIDYVIRRAFHNYHEYLDLYGEDQPVAEMPLPRVSAARLVPNAIKRRLAGLVPA